MKNSTLTITMLVCLTLGACAHNKKEVLPVAQENASIIDKEQADTVVRNLVYTLTQLPELHPLQTTVQMGRINSQLGDIVKTRLIDAGYGTQIVSSDVGNNYVKYKYENSISNDGPVLKFSLSIGFITAEREYQMVDERLIPDSPVMVMGSESTSAMTNDVIFGEFEKSESYANDTFYSGNEIPEIVVMAAARQERVNDFALSIREQMHAGGDKQYQHNLDGYETAEESILVFENEKIRMGKDNKQAIRAIAKSYNPDTDLITVVGCSQGPTNVQGGNEALAMGRANRVKEELLFANVPSAQIFEEGCWAKTPQNDLPRRGVVVRLKRKTT